MPQFAHVSLILAPDRSKLSKRHGATSVGQVSKAVIAFSSRLIIGYSTSDSSYNVCFTLIIQYREMGFLPQGMVNYLALLGWGDGTENEFFTLEQLGESFLLTIILLCMMFIVILHFSDFLVACLFLICS